MIEDMERFELKLNGNGQVDIIDWVESKEKGAICIYNDLGVIPFSSANQLCELLNKLSEENVQLKGSNERFSKTVAEQIIMIKEYREENEQLFNLKENVFNSIDGKIKRGEQAIEWGKSTGADVGAMVFHIELLKQLKKELLK